MKKIQTASGQRIKKEIIDHLQDTKEDAIKERFTDYVHSGILPGSAVQFNLVPGSANTILNPKVTIQPGIGYASTGERILISSTFDDITNPTSFLPINTTHVTDNGLGADAQTPRSTGSQNIPLTLGAINKVWIGYLQVTDDSQFTLRKDSDEKQFFKLLDGYEVKVQDTNPDTTRFIYLGQIDLTVDLLVTTGNISLSNRTLATLSNKTIEQGAGSLLDSDFLDGKDSTEYQTRDEKNQKGGYAGLDENRFIILSSIPQGPDSSLNADKVDGFHALPATDGTLGTGAAENNLVALDSTGKFPSSVIPPVAVPPAPVSPAPYRFLIQGTPVTTTKVAQALTELTATITEFNVYVDNLPTGSASLTVSAAKNGAVFSNITYSSSDPQYKNQTGLTESVSVGDRVSINITTAGTGSYGGEDIVISLRAE